ncbi:MULTISPECIES: Na+/H+ antiporter [Peribacillus]|uniref:Na+/H+ antiporter n=1 Tax=Peribacillus TaxID=2675229 RepID=UPI0021A53D9D|nr:Na+/H+ antiporter [Peribacillus sp. BBB004]
MEFFLVILALLILIGMSNVINHFIPFIPVPLIQITLGVILALLPLGMHVEMETELFLLLFIAPLLFNDGKNVPRTALWKLRAPILMLALGLVFITVWAGGYLINWMIPSIPLPAAFALAAILSPTDVVAVSALASRVKLPKSIMHLLEGEGLMNDASGLVAFKFAVAATVTGVFSLVDATFSFIWISIGGFVGGAIIAFIIIRLRVVLRRLGMEDVTMHMLIQILTPFIIFLAVEHFHLSGILAVVAGGIVHAVERDREISPTVELQVVSRSTWSVILYILNGLVFVLLGLQIPSVAKIIFQDPAFNNGQVILYIVVITLFLFALRFIWLTAAWSIGWMMKKTGAQKPDFKAAGIITISGVRGAVTLAGSFSIPYVLADGSPFPERSLIIFIAAGVILLTLIVASVFLPIVARSEEEEVVDKQADKTKTAAIHSHQAAIRVIESQMTDENREAALSIISRYFTKINELSYVEQEKEPAALREEEKELRFKALEAEQRFLDKLIKDEKVDRETAYICKEYIQRMESAVTNRLKFRFFRSVTLFRRSMLRVLKLFFPNKSEIRKINLKRLEKVRDLKIRMYKAAIQEIQAGITADNHKTSSMIIEEYKVLILKCKRENRGRTPSKMADYERELFYKGIQAERDDVQDMFEKRVISRDVANILRQQINLREALTINENAH